MTLCIRTQVARRNLNERIPIAKRLAGKDQTGSLLTVYV